MSLSKERIERLWKVVRDDEKFVLSNGETKDSHFADLVRDAAARAIYMRELLTEIERLKEELALRERQIERIRADVIKAQIPFQDIEQDIEKENP